MRYITDGMALRLEWTQPSALKRQFELLADGDLAAALRFRSAFGSLATVESADGCWTFKRIGFWRTRVTVRACEQETELARFRNNTWQRGGTLELPDGRRLRATTNFWQTRYEFIDDMDQALVRYQMGGFVRMSAVVEILPPAHGLAELPWLVALGWYLAILMREDTAAAT